MENQLVSESTSEAAVAQRRTFAIISHPDAGKTTLTEKLLLYSGMVRTAGMVRARKGGRATTSDWIGMEQERGISISSSAMQFPYKNAVINLLDTPGHQDFSEDTYRTLTAADSAVMVIDAAKGVEAQTRKLFTVCRMRAIPILTFINKMDLPGRDPFDLMHELEQLLNIKTAPMNWPIGSGKNFKGVVDPVDQSVLLFSKGEQGGAKRASVERLTINELRNSGKLDSDECSKVVEELDLLAGAGDQFSLQDFLAGEVSPVFFGSALTNFGVEPFFDRFVEIAPAPRPVKARAKNGDDYVVDPIESPFTGFAFKIQANMNPKHRDSMAFIRICSGKFERDMNVTHHRTGKSVRLSHSFSLVAQDRSTINEAYAGDIIGVINPGVFAIGDTVSQTKGPHGEFDFVGIPRFPPEVVARVRPKDVMRKKAFDKGVEQLSNEGTVQCLRSFDNPHDLPLVAAVGRLQFEVLEYRLKEEYGVEIILEPMPYQLSAWLEGDPKTLRKPQGAFLALDDMNRVVVLFTSEWERRFLVEKNPEHVLKDFV